jgi:hypothetical protein
MKIVEITYSPLIVNEVFQMGGEKFYQIGKKILLKCKNGSIAKFKRRSPPDIWMDASLFVEVPLDFVPDTGDCYNEGDEIQEVTMIDPDNFLPVKRRFKKLKEGEL